MIDAMGAQTSRPVQHPLFARLLVRMRAHEPPEQLEHRRELLAGLTGRVVDIGAGNGANFACSVPDQEIALREIGRVLRPGGELRFYEHVIAQERRLARLQRLVDRSGLWPRLAGGCHPARDTAAAIASAGFRLERCRRLTLKPCALAVPVAPHILGVARRAATHDTACRHRLAA